MKDTNEYYILSSLLYVKLTDLVLAKKPREGKNILDLFYLILLGARNNGFLNLQKKPAR